MAIADTCTSVFYQHRQNCELVDRKLRQRIFNCVVIGHALGIVIPLALGILLGLIEPAKMSTMTLDITDFDSDLSGPSALEQGNGVPPPPPPTEVPQEPETPDTPPQPDAPDMPTPSVVPDIPPVQESDSTERPLKPPPKQPAKPKAPVIAQAKPKPQKQPTTPKSTPKPAPASKPTKPAQSSTGTAYNDKWKPDDIGGDPRGGDNRTADGNGSGGNDAEGNGGAYDLRLKAYIETQWNPPARAALGGRNPSVRILLDIAPDGRVTRSVIETGSGMALMDDSVRELLKNLIKVPAPGRFIKDKPVRMELTGN